MGSPRTAWLRIIEPVGSDREIRGDRVTSWWPAKPVTTPYRKSTKLKGSVKVTMKNLEGDDKSERVRLVGGPLDGSKIATYLYLRTGRGKATTHISMPTNPESFEVHTEGGERGRYAWNDERNEYWYESGTLDRKAPRPGPTQLLTALEPGPSSER